MDTSFTVSSEYYFGPYDTNNYPAYPHNLDFYETNSIYYGGTCNQALNDFSSNQSFLMIGNFDTTLNLVWQQFIGGDMYYTLWGVTATTDGGCLLVGTSFDYLTRKKERNIFLVKVDSSGVITGIGNKSKGIVQNVITYPSPCSDYFFIEGGPQIVGAKFSLMDISGNHILEIRLSSTREKIDHTPAEDGIYFWRITKSSQLVESGSMVILH